MDHGDMRRIDGAADRLAVLYDEPFGGKALGRFRVSMKHLRKLLGRGRVYSDDVRALTRAIYERGFVLIDLETYFVVMKQRTFTGYRRTNDDSLERCGKALDAG